MSSRPNPFLPTEILSQIFTYSDGASLKNARAAGRQAQIIADPLVFRRVLLIPHITVVQDFDHFISTSRVSKFIEQIDVDARWVPAVHQVLARLYKLGIRRPMPQGDVPVAVFIAALAKIPALRKVRVHCSDCLDRSVPPGTTAYYLARLRELIRHHAYTEDRRLDYRELPYWQASFYTALEAVCPYLDHLELLQVDLTKEDFMNSHPALGRILPKLKKLHVDYSFTYWDEVMANVPSTLVLMAPELTHLRARFLPSVRDGFADACFDVHPGKVGPLGVWFDDLNRAPHRLMSSGSRAFPHLRSLSLAGLWCSTEELHHFLTFHCPSLRDLVLEDICLKVTGDEFQPCWARFLKGLKSNSALTSLDFRGDLSQDGPPYHHCWLAKSENYFMLRRPTLDWFLDPTAKDEDCPLNSFALIADSQRVLDGEYLSAMNP